jgi:hypothetical protein
MRRSPIVGACTSMCNPILGYRNAWRQSGWGCQRQSDLAQLSARRGQVSLPRKACRAPTYGHVRHSAIGLFSWTVAPARWQSRQSAL